MKLTRQFTDIGGQFLTSEEELAAKLKDIDCFVFDWDGVFNDGTKANKEGSSFSEPDSMGLNMLRFSYWLIHGKLPITTIITGENNITAQNFAEREHLDAVLLNTKNKGEALKKLTTEFGTSPNQTLFVFDDILDLSAAKIAGLTFCVKRISSPLFNTFTIDNNLCDYVSGSAGGQNAVREITELLIGLNGNYNTTIEKRMEYTGDYENYLGLRNSIEVKKKS